MTKLLELQTPVTFKDQPNVKSAVFYTEINKCNLNCYKCHNRKAFGNTKAEFLSKERLIEKLQMYKMLGVKLIIISGGEPTLGLDEETINIIKKEGFDVRVDTNGTYPDKVKELIKWGVDGFAIDIKIPLLGIMKKKYKEILYSNTNISMKQADKYRGKLIQTLEIIKENADKLKYIVLRTVTYPQLTKEELDSIQQYVKKLNIDNLIYQQNDFIEI